MKSQDHYNQKFNSRNWNPKSANLNRVRKNCRELNGDNAPNDIDRIFIELNYEK